MVDSLKEIRKSIGYTQSQAADYLKVSLRSYKSYENDPQKSNSIKYLYLVETLGKLNTIDETHGKLSIVISLAHMQREKQKRIVI